MTRTPKGFVKASKIFVQVRDSIDSECDQCYEECGGRIFIDITELDKRIGRLELFIENCLGVAPQTKRILNEFVKKIIIYGDKK